MERDEDTANGGGGGVGGDGNGVNGSSNHGFVYGGSSSNIAAADFAEVGSRCSSTLPRARSYHAGSGNTVR